MSQDNNQGNPVTHKTLGVIGLGSMGYGAAVSALRKGVTTIGLDRSDAFCARSQESYCPRN